LLLLELASSRFFVWRALIAGRLIAVFIWTGGKQSGVRESNVISCEFPRVSVIICTASWTSLMGWPRHHLHRSSS
jgi:hypothetical protein